MLAIRSLTVPLVVCIAFLFRESKGVELTNVALGKPTSQLSTYQDRDSHYAVDGSLSPEVHISCTHTADVKHNFWVVDLLASYQIHSIRITNRDIMSDRLRDFYIYVSNLNPLPIPSLDGSLTGQLCLAYPGILPAEGPHSLTCDQDSAGRYIYLWKPKESDFLTICEFEVMVEDVNLKIKKGGFRILSGKKSSQSPFYATNVERSSRIDCVRACLAAPGGSATIVQMNTLSNKCECVQESELDVAIIADVLTPGWILMKSAGN